MLGTIIGIEENDVFVKLEINVLEFKNLINVHVVLAEDNKIIIGEIINIKDGIAQIGLLGEMEGEKFIFGVSVKPSFASQVKLVSKEKIPMIISVSDYKEYKDLYLGESSIYEGIKIHVNINNFFSNHFAILGSTGSGKSCGVARIIQNIFDKKQYIAYKSSLFIFDAYGEYHTAFKDINKYNPGLNFKTYTTNLNFSESEVLKIPVWLMGIDDIALLLNADKPSQLSIIEKALKLVNIFARNDETVMKYQNDIIARALIDILASGRPSSQIRDQVYSVLSFYNTTELNLETPVFQPGYTRPLKQCLLIDASGKIRDMELLNTFFEKFFQEGIELKLPNGDIKYTLDDLENALSFALISEGVLSSEKIYEDCNNLKVRIHSLNNSTAKTYFEYDNYIDIGDYVKDLLTASNGKKAQIINFNINYIDDRLAKVITKVYSRMLFEYAKNNDTRNSMPFHIILEEAHRYVQNDNDINILGYNIFDRITKEGRKYGVILGLISQRPSELSETAISQCNNFLVFKMIHPYDIEYIKKMIPNITNDVVKRLKILQPGNCIGFGSGFKVPVLIKLDMPNPAPSSSSCNISATWFVEMK